MLIYSYNPHSQSARKLSEALGIKRIKHQGSRFTGRKNPTVINWGASQLPAWSLNCGLLNHPLHVAKASNKLTFFQSMPKELVPEWTTDPDVARQWLEEDVTVVCRHVLNGHSGVGIELVANVDPLLGLPKAPLYVQYVPKKDEYRVHVFDGEVIDVQRKARKLEVPDEKVNWQVRNHQNGFIYQRQDVALPDACLSMARDCMQHSGLLFGAVDVIWNEKYGKSCVLEINTAPGLEGQTVEAYANAFRRYM